MAQPAGRLSDVQVRTRAEEDEYGVPTPRARAAELRAADPRLVTAGQIVEAVGIEPYVPRYANPKRTLGFPAYRCHPRATRTLTHVPCSTLESSYLPCALVTMWSLTISARANTRAFVFERAGRARRGPCQSAPEPAFGAWCLRASSVDPKHLAGLRARPPLVRSSSHAGNASSNLAGVTRKRERPRLLPFLLGSSGIGSRRRS